MILTTKYLLTKWRMLTTEKTCFKCNRSLPIADFYAHPQMGDGRLNKCKECTKKDVSANYRANRPHFIEYEAMRARTTERRKARYEYLKSRDPIKRHATNMTSGAIRNGRLVRKPCEKCGTEKVEAHHDDYTKPLDVRWLCRRHHLEHHGKESYAGAV